VRICIAATPSVAIPTLEAILASDHEIVSVITRPDAPAGRGRGLKSSAVSDWASANGITLHKPESIDEIPLLVAASDLVITIGFGVLLPETTLNIPKHGFINLHFSLLPRWRGAAPVQRALEAGDSITGVTVFQLDAGMDTGPIYTSLPFDIEPSVNTSELLLDLSSLGVQAVLSAISQIENGESPKVQSGDGATRANKLSTEEAQINWSKNSLEIVNKIRAFYPNPGAWSTFRAMKIKIESAKVSELILKPGVIALQGRSVVVGTGNGAIELLSVKAAGKSAMSAQDWANGQHLLPNEKFEQLNG
jgi:methionyl-tRNA formyltransferase